MSFEYPGFLSTQPDEINSSKMEKVAYFESGDIFNKQCIIVSKNKTDITPAELRDETVSINNNSSTSKVLSTTTATNPNSVVVETLMMTIVLKENILKSIPPYT